MLELLFEAFREGNVFVVAQAYEAAFGFPETLEKLIDCEHRLFVDQNLAFKLEPAPDAAERELQV